jgi:putative transposase
MHRKRPDYSNYIVHAMNRKVERRTLFHSNDDYNEFRSLLNIALRKYKLRILEWTIMPNHWHLLLWPEGKEQLPQFMRWLTSMHARVIRGKTETVGNGAVYQGRYRSSFVKQGIHLDRIRNYIAMNPVKANLVSHSSDWLWGSARRVLAQQDHSNIILSAGPQPISNNLEQLLTDIKYLDQTQRKTLSQMLHQEIPYGDEEWVEQIIRDNNIEHLINPVGRPKK